MHILNLPEVIAKLNLYHQSYLEEKNIEVVKSTFRCILRHIHEDTTPSTKFLPDGNGKVHCFGCGNTYGILDSYAVLENLPLPNTPGWIEQTLIPLAKKYEIQLESRELTEQEKIVLAMQSLNGEIAQFLASSEWSTEIKAEIKKRKWKETDLRNLQIGSIPNYKALAQYLSEKGYSPEAIAECDADREDLFSSNNLIFPIRNINNQILGFTARNTTWRKDDHLYPKCVNTSNNLIFTKSHSLLGIERISQLVKRGEISRVYIVEGSADWLSLTLSGIKNVVAINGSSMSAEQVRLLRKTGIREISLCLDTDEAGEKGTSQIIRDLKESFRGIKLSITSIPNKGTDPDEFLRKYGKEAFLSIPNISAFSWETDHYISLNLDKKDIINKIFSSLLSEVDPVIIYETSTYLSERLGYPLEILTAKFDSLRKTKGDEILSKKEKITSETVEKLRNNPQDARFIAEDLLTKLNTVEHSQLEERFGFDEFLSHISNQEILEETKAGGLDGFTLPNHPQLQDTLYGPWRKDCLFLIGGKPNVGKTNFLIDLVTDILLHNNGTFLDPYGAKTQPTIVFYHTIDDNRAKIVNRIVTNIASKELPYLTMNMMANPRYYKKIVSDPELFEQVRRNAYTKIRQLAFDRHLLIKGIEQGMSLDYISSQLSWIRNQFPATTHSLVYVLDNFSKIKTEGVKEQGEIQKISEEIKSLTSIHNATIITTIEYTKLEQGSRPSDNNFRGSNQMWYDADITAHMINNFAEDPNSLDFWRSKENEPGTVELCGPGPKWPTVELFISKNKITEHRNKAIFYDAIPPQSTYRELTEAMVKERQMAAVGEEYRKDTPSFGVGTDQDGKKYRIGKGGKIEYLS